MNRKEKLRRGDVERCTYALVSTHTNSAKVPGAKSLFGLFPTHEGALVYSHLLEKVFTCTMQFKVQRVRIKHLKLKG